MKRLVLGAVAFFFFAAGIYLFFESVQFVSGATRATGTVVKVDTHRDSDGDRTYRATIRFHTEGGQIFDGRTHTDSSSYNYAIGARVDILYAPENPAIVRIDSFFQLYLTGIFLTAVGGVLTLATIYRLPTSISFEYDRRSGRFRRVLGGQFHVDDQESDRPPGLRGSDEDRRK